MIMIATESHSPLVLEILSLVNWTGLSVAELTYAGRLGTGKALTLKAVELISEVRPIALSPTSASQDPAITIREVTAALEEISDATSDEFFSFLAQEIEPRRWENS